jgi:hypothetical protein
MNSYEVRDLALILGEVSRHASSSKSRSKESLSIMGGESIPSIVTLDFLQKSLKLTQFLADEAHSCTIQL